MPNKKLHELIQLAKEGKKFQVLYPKTEKKVLQNFFTQDYEWTSFEVTTDWEYKELREPEVVEFILLPSEFGPSGDVSHKLKGKKWKVVCTEVMDD